MCLSYQVHKSEDSGSNRDIEDERIAYVVELYDIQDARQALIELKTTQPWGPTVRAGTVMRTPSKRRQGRDILALIDRWRHGNTSHASDVAAKNTRVPVSKSPPPVNCMLPVPIFPSSTSISVFTF